MAKDIKNKTPINALPEYKIRTMKDDLAKVEAELPIAPKAPPLTPPEVKKAPLPGTEELISEKKPEVPKPPKTVKKELPQPETGLPRAEKPPKAELPKPLKIEKPKSGKKPRTLIILIIILLILAGLGGFFYWQKEKPSLPPQPPAEAEPPPSEPLIPIGQIYQNKKYNFELKLPATWKDFQTAEADIPSTEYYPHTKALYFNLPLKDNGLGNAFIILIFTPNEWQELLQKHPDCKNEKCKAIAQNDKYIIGYSIALGTYNFRDMDMKQVSEDIPKIITTFKLK